MNQNTYNKFIEELKFYNEKFSNYKLGTLKKERYIDQR